MKKTLCVLVLLIIITTSVLANGQSERKKNDKITLTYTTWMTKGEDKYWIDAFMEENPDIEVKMDMLEGAKYKELMRTRILSNDIPDVMLIMGDQVKDYGREGYLADLSGTFAAELQKKTPMANDFSTIDEKIVSINVNGGYMGYVWYNKKLFKDLGLNVPKTMDEFWSILDKLKQAGKDPILLGGADTWTYKMLRFAAWTQLAEPAITYTGLNDIYEALYKGATITDVFMKHGEFIEKLVLNNYLVQASMTTTWPQSSQLFADGNVGIFPQGPWVTSLPEIKNADPEKFELGVFALPIETQEGNRYALATMNRFVSVSSESEHPEAAMKLYEFITRKENMEGYLESQSLTTLLDLEYELPEQIIKFKNIVTGEKYTSVPANFPAPAGWHDGGQVDQFSKNIQAGAEVKEALKELEHFYNDGKETIKF